MPGCVCSHDGSCPDCVKKANQEATTAAVNTTYSSSYSCDIPDWWYDGYNRETETPVEPEPLTPEEEEFQKKMKAEEAEQDKRARKAYLRAEEKRKAEALKRKNFCRQQVQRAAIRAEALIACLLGAHFKFSSSKAFVSALQSYQREHEVLTKVKKLFGVGIKSRVIDLVNQDITVKKAINKLYDDVLLFDKEHALHLIHETDDFPVLRFVSPFMSHTDY